jgi:hypothetical protein
MYRIELSPGEETVFRSIEELAVAIRRGVVTPRARIYHNASSKWLPIQFHPHYKVAVSMPLTQAALVAGPPVKPLSTLSLQQPTDPEPLTHASAPMSRMVPPDHPVRDHVRAERPAPKKKKRSRPAAPRRQIRLALVGALLIAGAQWVLSSALTSPADSPALLRTQRRLIAAHAAMKQVSSANTAAMVPVLRTPPTPTAPAAAVSEPELRPASTPPAFAPWTPPIETASTPELEPAPTVIEMAVPTVPRPDSLAAKMIDSTNKKAMKGILRAVSGTPAKEKTPAKR